MEVNDRPSERLGPDDRLIGRQIDGRYTILEEIGRGGMGRVYKAFQSPLNRVVALKVLSPNAGQAQDPGFEKRFFLEASVTARLSHPNTVTIFDYGHTRDGVFYIAMEYLEGRVLSQILAREVLPWRRTLNIVAQVARSIRHAHLHGVIHRDLKAANVMVMPGHDGDDLAKVLDFGLVKFVGEARLTEDPSLTSLGQGRFANPSGPPRTGPGRPELTMAGIWVGSPGYVAPEQARNLAVDPRTDIYSLGVLLWQMLAGRMPFIGITPLETVSKQINEIPVRPSTVNPTGRIPAELDAVVMKMLKKSPDQRFQTMEQLLRALKAIGAPGARAGDSWVSGVVPTASPRVDDACEFVEITEELPVPRRGARLASLRALARTPKALVAVLAGAGVLVAGMALGHLFFPRGSGASGDPQSNPAHRDTEAHSPSPSQPAVETAPLSSPPPSPAVALAQSQPGPDAMPPAPAPPAPESAPEQHTGRGHKPAGRAANPPALDAATSRRGALPTRAFATLRVPELSPPRLHPALSAPMDAPDAASELESSQPDQASSAPTPVPLISSSSPSPVSLAPATSRAPAPLFEPVFQTVEAVYGRRTQGHEPPFPSSALKAEVEGTVVAKIVIGAEGKVNEITLIQSHPAFERVVRDTVAEWSFRPHLVGGRPTSVYTVIRFTFRLE